jgi:hypothetical protein
MCGVWLPQEREQDGHEQMRSFQQPASLRVAQTSSKLDLTLLPTRCRFRSFFTKKIKSPAKAGQLVRPPSISLAALGLPDSGRYPATRLIVAKLLKKATRLSDGFYFCLNNL